MLRKIYYLIVANIVLIFLALPGVAAANPAQRVLFISSYHPQFPTFFQQVEGIKSVLDPRGILLDIEFMDTKRFVQEQNLANFYQSLAYKLAHTRPYDAIITGDDAALQFAIEHQQTLFALQPIVFAGVNNQDLARQQNDNRFITGVMEAVSMEETLALMMRLHPGVSKIVALVDGTPSGQGDLQTYYRLGPKIGSVELTHLSLENLSFAELVARLRALDEGSEVLLLSAYRDKYDRILSFHESLNLIKEHLTRPLYHLWHHGIGDGLFGGKVVCHKAQGEAAASLVLQIFDGRSVADIEVQEASPNHYVFDYRQLARHGIDVDSLPKNSMLLHQSLDFHQLNEKYLWFEAVFVLGLCLAVTFLLLHIRSRKRYENAIQESEARYRAIVEDQTELICRNQPEGTLTFVNDAYCRYFGRECSELVGSNLLTMVAEAYKSIVEEHFQGLGLHNPVATYQHQVVAGDGGVYWMQWTNRAIFDHSGQVIEIQGVGRDITQQKRAEMTLRDSEQFLSSILTAAPIGMGVARNRELVWVSDNLCKMLGYDPSDLLHRSARILYESEQEFEHVGEVKYRGIVVHGSGSIETRWVKKDSQVVDILLSSALIDPMDQTAGTTFTAMDITDQKRSEKILQKVLAEAREARDQIEVMLRSVADGLIFTDSYNRIVLMSDSAEMMLGKQMSDIFFKPIAAVIDSSSLVRQLEKIVRGDCAEGTVEIELTVEADDQLRIIEVKSSAVDGNEGIPVGVITLLRDVSRERSLDRLKSEFISTAAHELRTPLTAVMGFSELLMTQEGCSKEERAEFLSIIHRKSEVLGKIIDDMLDLAKIDSGQVIRVNMEYTDIGEIIQQCVADYRVAFPEHCFELLGTDQPLTLMADSRKLCQVLENLLNNAVNFSAVGSLIQIMCEKRQDEVAIVVKDEGPGLTVEQIEKVFDKFYRVDASNTAREGLGLGLAIVKGVVEAHGGRIWIESEVGKGVRVEFTLPLCGVAE
ncbi:MAG: PAS domain S-box protein [Desulfuromonadaceae bacterium]|nr:PAS domain S-box protein [Desulfuromonadaceae bacterium]